MNIMAIRRQPAATRERACPSEHIPRRRPVHAAGHRGFFSRAHVHDGISEDEYVSMRNTRDEALAMPALLLSSV